MAKRHRSPKRETPREKPSAIPSTFVRDVLGVILLCLCTFIAYAPSLRGAFLWDDDGHVTKPALQSVHGLWRIWFDLGSTQQYYPLLHTAFWIEHRLWDGAPFGYHLINVILHIASAVLVVLIVRRLRIPGAWLAGFIFALHPVAVESVAWISEQKTALSGFFYLAAMLVYLHFDETRSRRAYAFASTLFALALMTKTVTATLPAALLLILWWRRGKLEWRRDFLPLCPWLAVGIGAGLFTAWVEATYIGAHGGAYVLSTFQRLLLSARVIWFYFGKVIWPANLAFVYPHWSIDPAQWWQYSFLAGILIVLIALSLYARRNRAPLTALLFFIGTLAPVLGFLNVFPFRYSYVADHFQYLAMLGVIVPVAAIITNAFNRWFSNNAAKTCAAAILIAILGSLTRLQAGGYTDNETLFRATLAINPDSSMAHNNLGFAIAKRAGGREEAIEHFQAALLLDPKSAEAHENLGLALSKDPRTLAEAIEHLQTALRLQPDYPESHLNLGAALERVPGRTQDAIPEFEAALRLKPDYAEAHLDLGTALSSITGRTPDAIAEYEAALRLDPESALAHYSLANVLAQTPGAQSRAIAEYESALRADPNYVAAHANFGALLSTIPGRSKDAIAQYEAALLLDPDSVQTHFNLALVLSRMPEGIPEAIAHLKDALRLRPDLRAAQDLIARLQTQSLMRPSDKR